MESGEIKTWRFGDDMSIVFVLETFNDDGMMEIFTVDNLSTGDIFSNQYICLSSRSRNGYDKLATGLRVVRFGQ